MAAGIENFMIAVLVGTLFAIVYALRVLVLMERRVARMDLNIEQMTKRVLKEELVIESAEKRIETEEKKIEKALKGRKTRKGRK